MSKVVKMTPQQFLKYMRFDVNANTFSVAKYIVNEGGSKTDKSYPAFDGKHHLLQKEVETLASIGTKYKGKVDRKLEANGINFNWEIKAPLGRFFPDYDKNRSICFAEKVREDETQWTPENAYLAFIVEVHNKPKTQYFHLGQPISREEARTTKYMRPSGLQTKKNTVKNSMFNKAMEAATNAEAEGNLSLAAKCQEAANRLANTDDFKELEFYYRTVKLSNLKMVRVNGMEIHIEE